MLTSTSPPLNTPVKLAAHKIQFYIISQTLNFSYFFFVLSSSAKCFSARKSNPKKNNVGTPHKTPKKLFRIIFLLLFSPHWKTEQIKTTTRLPLTTKRNERSRRKKNMKKSNKKNKNEMEFRCWFISIPELYSSSYEFDSPLVRVCIFFNPMVSFFEREQKEPQNLTERNRTLFLIRGVI